LGVIILCRAILPGHVQAAPHEIGEWSDILDWSNHPVSPEFGGGTDYVWGTHAAVLHTGKMMVVGMKGAGIRNPYILLNPASPENPGYIFYIPGAGLSSLAETDEDA
jgi:hypothetical protein